MWTYDLNDTTKVAFADNPALMELKAIHDELHPTFLFRRGRGFYCVWVFVYWRCGGATRLKGGFVFAVCRSAVVYIATYFFLGVASDYRYS